MYAGGTVFPTSRVRSPSLRGREQTLSPKVAYDAGSGRSGWERRYRRSSLASS